MRMGGEKATKNKEYSVERVTTEVQVVTGGGKAGRGWNDEE